MKPTQHTPCHRTIKVGDLDYTAEQINQLLSLIPYKADRKEISALISFTGQNYIGHYPSATLLKPQDRFAWALVGSLSAAAPYFHYTAGNEPEGYTAGWNNMQPVFGTYDLAQEDKEDEITSEDFMRIPLHLPLLTADRAIADEHGNRIADTYETRQAVRNHIREVYNEQFTENPPLILEEYITPNMLSQDVKDMLSQAGATINNVPDGEDLTTKQGVLKLSDKTYNPGAYSGLGRVYLRKNLVGGQNLLTQAMVSKPNTIYIIQYDYDLNGAEITIPSGCVLDFQGGSLNNGAINVKSTYLVGNINTKTNIKGSINNKEVRTSWFGNNDTYLKDLINLKNCNTVVIDSFYEISNWNIDVPSNKTIICKSTLSTSSNKDIGDVTLFNLAEGASIKGLHVEAYNVPTYFIIFSSNNIIEDINIQYKKHVDKDYHLPIFNDDTLIHKYNNRFKNIKFENYYCNRNGGGYFVGIWLKKNNHNFLIEDITINNIKVRGNDTIATGFGVIRGILVSNDTQQKEYIELCSGTIDKVYMTELQNIDANGNTMLDDADGLYFGSGIPSYGYTSISVTNCKFINCGKRCFKIQGDGVTIDNVYAVNDGFGFFLELVGKRLSLTNAIIKTGAFIGGEFDQCFINNINYETTSDPLDGYTIEDDTITNTIISNSVFKSKFYFLRAGTDIYNVLIDNCIIDISGSLIQAPATKKFEPIKFTNCEFNINQDASIEIVTNYLNCENCIFNINTIKSSNTLFLLGYNTIIKLKHCKFVISSNINNMTIIGSKYDCYGEIDIDDVTFDTNETSGLSLSFISVRKNIKSIKLQNVDFSNYGSILYHNVTPNDIESNFELRNITIGEVFISISNSPTYTVYLENIKSKYYPEYNPNYDIRVLSNEAKITTKNLYCKLSSGWMFPNLMQLGEGGIKYFRDNPKYYVKKEYEGNLIYMSIEGDIKQGEHVYDSTLNKPKWWTGTKWVDATGAEV